MKNTTKQKAVYLFTNLNEYFSKNQIDHSEAVAQVYDTLVRFIAEKDLSDECLDFVEKVFKKYNKVNQ